MAGSIWNELKMCVFQAREKRGSNYDSPGIIASDELGYNYLRGDKRL